MKKTFSVLTALGFMLAVAATAGAFTYTAQRLPIHGTALNNSGQVAGWYSTWYSQYAAKWDVDNGVSQFNGRSEAVDINNQGDVLIRKYGNNALWSPAGTVTDIPLDNVFAINDSVLVAGMNNNFPSVWSEGSGIVQITNKYGAAYDINSSGQVTGYMGDYAFVWDATSGLTTINKGYGMSINDSGQVAGYYRDYNNGSKSVGYIWDQSSGATELGTLGGDESQALAINNAGLVGGMAKTIDDQWHAFIYENGTMYDLNDLVISGLSMTLTRVLDINDNGQILASAVNEQYLLTPNLPTPAPAPVPEPSTIILFGFGLGITFALKKRALFPIIKS